MESTEIEGVKGAPGVYALQVKKKIEKLITSKAHSDPVTELLHNYSKHMCVI